MYFSHSPNGDGQNGRAQPVALHFCHFAQLAGSFGDALSVDGRALLNQTNDAGSTVRLLAGTSTKCHTESLRTLHRLLIDELPKRLIATQSIAAGVEAIQISHTALAPALFLSSGTASSTVPVNDPTSQTPIESSKCLSKPSRVGQDLHPEGRRAAHLCGSC